MLFRTLGLCLLFFSTFSFATGRSPAVEDFVGIEVDQADAAPQGTEILYNLEKDMSGIEKAEKKPIAQKAVKSSSSEAPFSPAAILGIMIILGLPIVTWLLVLHHLRTKATQESMANIEVLEKYRKDREEGRRLETSKRKAS